MPTISEHAKLRMRERCNANRKEMIRLSKFAFKKGIDVAELNGDLKNHVNYMLYLSRKRNGVNKVTVYDKYVFLFDNGKMVTVLELPQRFCGEFIKKKVEQKVEV